MLTLSEIDRFEEVIDVRSPTEYAVDHIPGARNFPALGDGDRHRVGTLYKQVSAFEAKKHGAAIISENIAAYLRRHFTSRSSEWQPLIYCWRGGERSAAFVHVLKKVGWPAVSLPGGYKAYRSMVRTAIDEFAPQLRFKALCGPTGVGKSRLLNTLARQKAQVLDLETLANHRGSVLGNPLLGKQPSQKYFESILCRTLRSFNPKLPVYVEAESRRIGRIHVPEKLLNTIRSAECIRVETHLRARIHHLMNEYHHFLADRKLLESSLASLTPFLGREKVQLWMQWQTVQDAKNMVAGLINDHYDPIYLKSIKQHFVNYSRSSVIVHTGSINSRNLEAAASKLLSATSSVEIEQATDGPDATK